MGEQQSPPPLKLGYRKWRLYEPHARTRNRDLARNALRFPRENWTFSEYRSPSLARIASTYFRNFRTQQNHGIPELLQSAAQDLSRGGLARSRAGKVACGS